MEENGRLTVDPEPASAHTGRNPSILHVSFEVAILLKGLHATLEIVSGVLVSFLKPDVLTRWIYLLTRKELAEDPKDFVANLIVKLGGHYTTGAQHFGIFYLVSHGIVNLAIVLLLWRRKMWAYPVAVLSLLLFIAYQAVRWAHTHSPVLILFTIIDLIVIWLTVSEFRRLKREPRH
jgi:uncharacterized membrane protein